MKSYTKTKDSAIEWIGEIPQHWDKKRLKFSVFLRSNKSYDESESRAYVGLENIESGTGKLIDINDEMIEADAKQFEENDVLFGKLRPYLAKVFLANFSGRCSGEFLVLKGIDFEPKFLSLLLISDGCIKTVDSSTYGTKMPRAEWSFIGNMVFPLPPKQEQKQISNFLDKETSKIDSQISRNIKLIELLKEKRQAAINQAVTKGLDPKVQMKDSGIEWIGSIPEHWKLRKISKSANKITNGYVGATRDILREDGVRYLQSLHIKNGQIRFDKKYFVDESWSKAHEKSILKEGDVLVVQTGGIGECATVTKDYENCNCHALIILQMKKNLGNGFFVSYLLRSNYGYNIINSLKTGALHPHLEIGYLKDVFLILPPIKEQEKIIDYLDKENSKINSLIKKTETQIQKLQEYRQTLISAAITGKIDVRQKVIAQ
jgi:type I restriction enzyme, S subunit